MQEGHVFETERLIVRRWTISDQPALLSLYSDRDVVKWVDDGRPLTAAEAARWMIVTQNNYERRGYGMFAIDERRTSTTVGFGGVVHPGDQPEAEVKYAFQSTIWGRGVATEFLLGLIAYGRASHGIMQLTATISPENKASARVLMKCGFRYMTTRAENDGSLTEVYLLSEA